MDSPAALTDATLDKIREDEGVFFSPRPNEQYYLTRLTRTQHLHQITQQAQSQPRVSPLSIDAMQATDDMTHPQPPNDTECFRPEDIDEGNRLLIDSTTGACGAFEESAASNLTPDSSTSSANAGPETPPTTRPEVEAPLGALQAEPEANNLDPNSTSSPTPIGSPASPCPLPLEPTTPTSPAKAEEGITTPTIPAPPCFTPLPDVDLMSFTPPSTLEIASRNPPPPSSTPLPPTLDRHAIAQESSMQTSTYARATEGILIQLSPDTSTLSNAPAVIPITAEGVPPASKPTSPLLIPQTPRAHATRQVETPRSILSSAKKRSEMGHRTGAAKRVVIALPVIEDQEEEHRPLKRVKVTETPGQSRLPTSTPGQHNAVLSATRPGRTPLSTSKLSSKSRTRVSPTSATYAILHNLHLELAAENENGQSAVAGPSRTAEKPDLASGPNSDMLTGTPVSFDARPSSRPTNPQRPVPTRKLLFGASKARNPTASQTPVRPTTPVKSKSAVKAPTGPHVAPPDFKFVFAVSEPLAAPSSPTPLGGLSFSRGLRSPVRALNRQAPAQASPERKKLPISHLPPVRTPIRPASAPTTEEGAASPTKALPAVRLAQSVTTSVHVMPLKASKAGTQRGRSRSPVLKLSVVSPLKASAFSTSRSQLLSSSKSSPLKESNVKVAAKASGLPTLSSLKSSGLKAPIGGNARPRRLGLPRAAATSINKFSGVTSVPTSVYMTHIPAVTMNGSPSRVTRARSQSLENEPPTDPPARKKRLRPVVPGTLTGWEGKPKDPAPQSPPPQPSTSASHQQDDSVAEAGAPDHTGAASESLATEAAEQSDGSTSSSSSSSSGSSTPPPDPNSFGSMFVDDEGSPNGAGVRRSRRLSLEKGHSPSRGAEGGATVSVGDEAPPTRPERPRRTASAPAPSTSLLQRHNVKSASVGPSGKDVSDIVELDPKTLASLTNKNTKRNEKYFNTLDTKVVKMDCSRPPSPTSKVRTIAEKEKERKEAARLKNKGPKAGKKKGAAKGSDLADEDEVMADQDGDEPGQHNLRKHARGAGDEEEYQTPKKIRLMNDERTDPELAPVPMLDLGMKLRKKENGKPSSSTSMSASEASASSAVESQAGRPNSRGKNVRWDRKLVFDFEKGETVALAFDARKGCLAKDPSLWKLDSLGNVPEAEKVPEGVQKDKVIVLKYLYLDDEDVEPPPSPPSPKRTSKRKRTQTSQ